MNKKIVYNKLDVCKNLDACKKSCEAFTNKNKDYFNGNIEADIIDLNDYPSYCAFKCYVKKLYKGNTTRDAKKAQIQGYFTTTFNKSLYIPDIHEIHTSLEKRQNEPMRKSYLKSIEEMGGYPEGQLSDYPIKINCNYHYYIHYGCFEPSMYYKQGSIETGKKLLAYIGFLRRGNVALYSMIIGHGSYLKYGIMYYLHFNLIELVYNWGKIFKDLDYIIYAGYNQGTDGLKLWKKKAGFKPARLYYENS